MLSRSKVVPVFVIPYDIVFRVHNNILWLKVAVVNRSPLIVAITTEYSQEQRLLGIAILLGKAIDLAVLYMGAPVLYDPLKEAGCSG